MLKAYEWKETEDDDCCVAVVATNIKEARKLAYAWWGGEVGHNADYIEQRIHRIKDADVSGLDKPQVITTIDGVKRGMYGCMEDPQVNCSKCEHIMGVIYKDDFVGDSIICEECRDKQ